MNNQFISINLMETIVDDKLPELMETSKMCTCDRCRADVRALALNGLPPKYIVTHVGELMTRVELFNMQKQTDITTAIVAAIKKVSENCRHDEKP